MEERIVITNYTKQAPNTESRLLKIKILYVIPVTFIFLTDSINTFLYIYKIIIFTQSIKDYVVEYIVFNIKIHPCNNYLQDITYKKR